MRIEALWPGGRIEQVAQFRQFGSTIERLGKQVVVDTHDAFHDEPERQEWKIGKDSPKLGLAIERRCEHQREVRTYQVRFGWMVLRPQAAQGRVVGLAQQRPGDDEQHLSRSSWPCRSGVHRRSVGRERVAQAVLAEMPHAFDGAQELVRRAGHQQLVIGDAAVTPLSIAGQRQRSAACQRAPHESAQALSPVTVKS